MESGGEVAVTALDRLRGIVGVAHVLTGDDVLARSDGYPTGSSMRALCIVRPADTDEVSRVLAFCDGAGLKVVPQGGLTGLVAGARTTERDVALSLERMRMLDPVDHEGGTVLVGAGLPLQALQQHAVDAGLFYPVDLGARGAATVGAPSRRMPGETASCAMA